MLCAGAYPATQFPDNARDLGIIRLGVGRQLGCVVRLKPSDAVNLSLF